MTAAGTLTFWGVRGSIPAPGLHTITFGGNTSCVSVEYREHVIIFDAGTVLRQLGLALLAREQPPITGSLFLTHRSMDRVSSTRGIALSLHAGCVAGSTGCSACHS